MPARKQNLWPFSSGKKRVVRTQAELAAIAETQRRATDAYLSGGRASATRTRAASSSGKSTSVSSVSYKGYTIKPTEDGSFVIPKLDPDSHFDSLKDAKAFLNSWKRNPEIKKAIAGAQSGGRGVLKLYDNVSGTIWNFTGGIPRRILGAAVGEKNPITDLAKRYRAQKNVTGPKKCVLCGAGPKGGRPLDVMHLDGNESNGAPENLAYGCRSCNGKLAAAFKKIGAGVPTRQYNPASKEIPTYEQYVWAVKHHNKGEHDEGGKVIHATPKAKRVEYAHRIAGFIQRKGRSGGDMPEWVTNPKGKRNPKNPADTSDRMYRAFHGKDPEGETIVKEEFHQHEHLAPLGVLVNFRVATLSGFDMLIGTADAEAGRLDYDETVADEKSVFLGSNEEGTQLYFVGGDQSFPLDSPKCKMGENTDWYRDDMIIGVLYEITYRTKKKFDKFKLTDYYHHLGEETGDQPMLRYDPLSPHLYVTGGKYKIKVPLIGMSPGIEN